MTSASVFTRSRQAFLTGVSLITLLALGLRLFRLASQSFWIDEISSIMAGQAPLDRIYERSAFAGNSLPAYFLLLKPFIGNGGGDLEFRTRLLSVIAGTLSVPAFIGVVYLWRRQRGTALLAGTLLAVNPLHLWYSQEVRGYSLMLLFGLLTLLCFELARTKHRPLWWVLYVLSALMAIVVHKTGLAFCAACGLWHAWEVFQRRENYKTLFIHAPLVITILIVASLKSHTPGEGYYRSATGLEIGYTFLTFLGGYSFGPSVTDIQTYGPIVAVSKNAFQVGVLLVLLLTLLFVFARNLRRLISGKEIQLLFIGVGIVSVYALLSNFPYNVRYALPALFGFLALAAVAAVDFEKSLCARLSLAGLLVVALWADGQWFYSWQYRKGDSRALANWLVENKNHVHSWTVLPDYMDVPVQWYLQPYPDVLAGEIPPKRDRTTTFPPLPDVLIITRRHHLAQPDEVIASYKSMAGGVQTNYTFAGFELYLNPATSQ